MKYKYYCRMRPPTPGAVPMKGLETVSGNEITIDDIEYYGYVEYSRELTESEIDDYELTIL